jgi:hypothetical protein
MAKLALETIRIASPCQVPWDSMCGDERVRFCADCKLHVYNLSEMTREEAEKFVAEREGSVCVRLHRRFDGTVLNRDCPVGLRALRRRVATVVGLALTGGLALFIWGSTLFGRGRGDGEASRWWRTVEPFRTAMNWIDPEPVRPTRWHWEVMGKMCVPLEEFAPAEPEREAPPEQP